MQVGFDLISDLHLTTTDKFDWAGRATSLYCLVPGNISADLSTVKLVLTTLSKYYQGVFYIGGELEFTGCTDVHKRINELSKICRNIRNVAFLYNRVIIMDAIAIIGCNGWYATEPEEDTNAVEILHAEDLLYLTNSITKLQKHIDVRQMIVLSNSVPNKVLYYGEAPEATRGRIDLNSALEADVQNKISTWVFGAYGKVVDTTIDSVHYSSNPACGKNPYWAHRINVVT